MRKRAAAVLFWSLAALSLALLATLLAVLGGIVPVDPPEESSTVTTEMAPPRTSTAETTRTTASTSTTPEQPPPAAATKTAPRRTPTLVVVTASRGDSWFSARVGSESGRVLDERVLPQGESVRLQGERIWLTVGAAGNVDVTVDGKPRTIAPGTVELVLTRAQSSAN